MSKYVIKNISAVLDGDTTAMKSVISLYVPMTVADPVEGHVPIQECVGVTLAIQENTVPPWPLVPTLNLVILVTAPVMRACVPTTFSLRTVEHQTA